MNNIYDAIQVLEHIRNDVRDKKVFVDKVDIDGYSGMKRVEAFIDPNGGGSISQSVCEQITKITVVTSK